MTRIGVKQYYSAQEALVQPLAVARPRLPTADAILPHLQRIDTARWYSNFGPLLGEMEERLAARFAPNTRVITTVNATQALTLALQAMDLPQGTLCAVPSWTFVATAHAVAQAGLVPWFVDIDANTWMLDAEATRAALSRAPGAVSAVIPVAAFGCMPDLESWKVFQDDTGVRVLIDAAAAFDAANDADLPLVVSLHATKVLGMGEGGFLATRDQGLADRVRQQTAFGFDGSRDALRVATNAKLSEYSAAVGLAALDAWPADRLRWFMTAQTLRRALIKTPGVRFQAGWGERWTTSVCVVGLPEGSADLVEAAFHADGVATRRWWGHGCHTSPAFITAPCDDLSNTQRLAGATLGLPFAIDLTPTDIARIADSLTRALVG